MEIEAAVPALCALKKFSGWWIWIVFSIRKSLTARYFDRNGWWIRIVISIRKSLTARYFDRNLLINVCMTAVSNQMSWWKNKIRDMSSAQISLRFDHDRYTWWPEFFQDVWYHEQSIQLDVLVEYQIQGNKLSTD